MTKMKKINGFTFEQWLVEAGLKLDLRMWINCFKKEREAWEAGIDPYSYVTAKPRPSEDPDTNEEITWFWSNAAERVATPFDVALVGKVGMQKDIEQKYKLLPGGKWVHVFE